MHQQSIDTKGQKGQLARTQTVSLEAPLFRLTTRLPSSAGEHDLRYTAVTSPPVKFTEDGYSLKHSAPIELCVGMTIYNESPKLLLGSLNALVESLIYMMSKSKTLTWDNILLVLIADGREKMDPGTMAALSAMGLAQKGPMQSQVIQFSFVISKLTLPGQLVSCTRSFVRDAHEHDSNGNWSLGSYRSLDSVYYCDQGTKLEEAQLPSLAFPGRLPAGSTKIRQFARYRN